MTFVKITVIPLKVNGIYSTNVISLLFQWYSNENTTEFTAGMVSLLFQWYSNKNTTGMFSLLYQWKYQRLNFPLESFHCFSTVLLCVCSKWYFYHIVFEIKMELCIHVHRYFF